MCSTQFCLYRTWTFLYVMYCNLYLIDYYKFSFKWVCFAFKYLSINIICQLIFQINKLKVCNLKRKEYYRLNKITRQCVMLTTIIDEHFTCVPKNACLSDVWDLVHISKQIAADIAGWALCSSFKTLDDVLST